MNRYNRTIPSGIDQSASRTAMWANVLRAMANKEKHPSLHGPDDRANIFISPARKFLLNFKAIRSFIRKRLTPGVYAYLMARTLHLDHLFTNAIETKVRQIVFLGAGYDTRSLRYKDLLRETRIFELDALPTQQDKIRLLQKAKISLPRQLSFAPIDFRNEKIEDVLAAAGYDRSQDGLFIWEGVTMYLSEDAVRDTLGFIRNHSGPGSTVAFDYFYKSVVDGSSNAYGAREQYEAVRKLGEPFQFGIAKGTIEAFLSENGFHALSHFTPEEFENKYLTDENGTLFTRMYRCGCNVHAGINP